jgi:branched-chain amino acid transport system ATP-binding protein
MTQALSVSHLSVSFSGFKAISDVSFSMDEGAIYSVIGPNGAGKSTLFNLITGLNKPDQGNVKCFDHDITGWSPEKRCHRGLGRSFQRSNIFPALTVFENIQTAMISRHHKGWGMFRPLGKRYLDDVMRLLVEVELDKKVDNLVTDLSHGNRRQLELAIALALEPTLLLLDEPTAGMSVSETRHCVALLRKIVDERGVKLLITEHDMNVVFEISDRIMVLSQGKNIAFGTPDQIRSSSIVRETYLGNDKA